MTLAGWGVTYLVWGGAERVLQRSLAAIARVHPELPVHVERLPDDTDPEAGLLAKSRMATFSPFEKTLFLDADTVVLGRLDLGFTKAERFGLACTINECPWARRYPGLPADLIEYNTGVLFFTAAARPIFDRWPDLAASTDSSTVWNDVDGTVRGMKHADQASFAVAVEDSGMQPFVLPMNYNLRPGWQRSFFMPVKVWHDYGDPPPRLVAISEACDRGDSNLSYMEFARDPAHFRRGRKT